MKSHLQESLNCLLWMILPSPCMVEENFWNLTFMKPWNGLLWMFLPSLWLKKILKLYSLECTAIPYFKCINPHHGWRIFWDLPFIKALDWISLSVNTFIMVENSFEISPSWKPKLLTLNVSTFTMVEENFEIVPS